MDRNDPRYDRFACTYGAGRKGKIYERLRKRSYRKHLRSEAGWQAYFDAEEEFFLSDAPLYLASPDWRDYVSEDWTSDQHHAYIAGVKDGLNAQELR